MTFLLAHANRYSGEQRSSIETSGYLLIGLLLVLATVAVTLSVLRRRARHTRPCPHCNMFIPDTAETCPVCARPVHSADQPKNR